MITSLENAVSFHLPRLASIDELCFNSLSVISSSAEHSAHDDPPITLASPTQTHHRVMYLISLRPPPASPLLVPVALSLSIKIIWCSLTRELLLVFPTTLLKPAYPPLQDQSYGLVDQLRHGRMCKGRDAERMQED